MKQIILGTAGHIDHGKTSLIKALTGTDTDRLKEEKKRGITIELGFAALDLPGGQHLGIVDVPGHEKFVKNMVAGATGIDIVAMVIAADEGVMPQTREHMEICTLLGIRHGLVVLTKIDMVDEEMLELATEDVTDYMQGTFLEDAPIVPVSSQTGAGLKTLSKTLDQMCTKVPERLRSSLFRLPVDRVFSMKGFGTVITGTLMSGAVSVGDGVAVYPRHVEARVRGIQVHNQTVETAVAGQRTAINFQGLERAAIERGQVVSSPKALIPSYMVDLWFDYLPSNPKPLKNRTRVRLHTGTNETLGNLILLDREELAPGEGLPCQIRLDAPVTLIKDDRYVIRSYSPVRTIGGGYVLNPIPVKHKRFNADIIEGLTALSSAEPEKMIALHAAATGYQGVNLAQLKLMTSLSEKLLNKALQNLLSKQTVQMIDKEAKQVVHKTAVSRVKGRIVEVVGQYHRDQPLKAGYPKEELKARLPRNISPRLLNWAILQLTKEDALVAEETLLRLKAHRVALKADQNEIRSRIMAAYQKGRLMPPYFKEVRAQLEMDPADVEGVMDLLVEEGSLVKVKNDLFFEAKILADLKARLVAFFDRNPEMTTPQFKEMTGASRKYLIPLLEFFDATRVTLRVGDVRKLRGG